jgi:hypothetical protein
MNPANLIRKAALSNLHGTLGRLSYLFDFSMFGTEAFFFVLDCSLPYEYRSGTDTERRMFLLFCAAACDV